MFLGAVGCASTEEVGEEEIGQQSEAVMGEGVGYDPPEPTTPTKTPGPDLAVGTSSLGWKKEYSRNSLVLTKITPAAEIWVRSVGTVTAPPSTLFSIRYMGTFREYLDWTPIPAMAPGESRLVTIPFYDCAQDPRSDPTWKQDALRCVHWYQIWSRADDNYVVDEPNEANNFGWQDLQSW